MQNKATSDKGDASIAAAAIALRRVTACFVLRTLHAPCPPFRAWLPLRAMRRPKSNGIAAKQASKDHRAESKGLTRFPGAHHLGDLHAHATLETHPESNPARAWRGDRCVQLHGISWDIGGQRSRSRPCGASRRGAALSALWRAQSGHGCRLSTEARRS